MSSFINMSFHKNHKKMVVGAAALILALIFIFWSSRASSISAYTVTPQDYTPSLLLSGEVISESQTTISTLTTGTIEKVFLEKGNEVKEGQVIAQLDDRLARTALERAQADVQLAQLNLDQTLTVTFAGAHQNSIQMDIALRQAQGDLERTQALAEIGGASRQELEQAKQALELAQERAQAAKISLQALETNGVNHAILLQQLNQRQLDLADKKLQLENCQITAPSDGQIVNLFANKGELVQAGSKFAVISSSKKSRIRIRPDQRYANLASINQTAQVWLPSTTNKKWPAKIVFTEPSGNSEQGSLTVELSLEEKVPELYPNRLVSVQIFGPQEKDVIIIPNTYLSGRDGNQGVWKAVQNEARFIPVLVGMQTPDGALILSGLQAGDIILEPINLKEGQKVAPQIKG